MSERYPTNQAGASVSGNGRYPRMLVAYGKNFFSILLSLLFSFVYLIFYSSLVDIWGHIQRRHGGGPSSIVETARMIKIEEFLDPPYPVPTRLCAKYVDPFFQTPADRSPPNRMRASHHFKVNKFFSQE
jgi:hypothetical protein